MDNITDWGYIIFPILFSLVTTYACIKLNSKPESSSKKKTNWQKNAAIRCNNLADELSEDYKSE